MPARISSVRSFALFALASLFVSQARADATDDLIAKQMQTMKIPGLSLLITQKDQVVKRAAYGKANLELDVPLTTSHVMESGSIGKCFTATVILQLMEEGKLKLDDKLESHFDKCPDSWKNLTIRQLLNQVTGLPDYAVVPGLGLVEDWTYDQWLEKMGKLPFDFPTGTQWAYRNTNYLILGKVAEKIEGKPILTLVKERIQDKLGMTHTYVADELSIIPNRAHGYLRMQGELRNGLFIAPGYGDGSLINSCEDLATFERGIREGKLLKPETVAMMQTPGRLPNGRKTPYGMAWFVRDVNKVHLVSHGGNTAGFFASMFRVPSADLTIILMGNVNDLSGDGFAQKIAELYVKELPFKKLPEGKDPDPKFTEKLLETLKSLAAGAPKEENLDADMISRLKTGRGQMALAALARFAKVGKLTFLETEKDDPDTIYRYRATVGAQTYVVGFTVTKDGKVYSVGQRAEEQ